MTAGPGEKHAPGGGSRRGGVLTYARRGNTLSRRQQEIWDTHAGDWVIPEESVVPGLDLTTWFGRRAPLVVEIGSGVGDATGALAAARPHHDVLALEVWRPGVASALAEVAAAGAANVRFCTVDAVWFLEQVLAPGQVREVWSFFPDPWPKKRHHKRRLVQPGTAAVVADRLEPGGTWRLATDWEEYAHAMREVLDDEPLLHGGVVPRWEERPETKFERRGRAAGRGVSDLAYRRVGL